MKTADLVIKAALAGGSLLFLLAILFGGDIDEDIGALQISEQ
jgi:hypothetical protein